MNILVTGGTSGVGMAAVELLAQNALYHVYFTYRTKKDIAEKICLQHPNTTACKLDFSNEIEVDEFRSRMQEWDIDVLVNNAYVGQPQSTHFHKIEASVFLESFKDNVIPTIKITQSAIKIFRKKKYGKIINIITGYVMNLPPAGFATYVGNKCYIEKMSDVINKEYSRLNITSNCILPEFMNTGFGDVDERLIEQTIMQHPLRKLLQPKEVADAIKFFVESSQQVNGVKLPINSAMYINN